MSCKVLQRLLSSGEYDELEDVVIAEGEFVETDSQHNPLRQVILGMTPLNLIIAERRITDYKEHPEVYFQTEADLYLDDLEVSSVRPICLLRMDNSYIRYELNIRTYDKIRYYEMANTRLNGDLEDTWARWLERIQYLREDPYGYVRAQFDEHDLPYPEYYVSNKRSRDFDGFGKSSHDFDADGNLLWKCLELDDIEFLGNGVTELGKSRKKKKKKREKSTKKKTRASKMKKWFKNENKYSTEENIYN